MKSIKEVLIDELPAKKIEATTLYTSVRRGVRASIKPWQFGQDHKELTGNALQEAYDNEIELRTIHIMEVIIHEIYL